VWGDFLFGDWREGEPSCQLELKEVGVFIGLEDAPDRGGMVVERIAGLRVRKLGGAVQKKKKVVGERVE
jgi:hypothetical protein